MTVAEALTVQAGLQKLDATVFVPSVAWWEPKGINECHDWGNARLRRVHVALDEGRCKFCGTTASEYATLEKPSDY